MGKTIGHRLSRYQGDKLLRAEQADRKVPVIDFEDTVVIDNQPAEIIAIANVGYVDVSTGVFHG